MHLMDETPDIIDKITEQQKAEETIKKKKERIKKAEKKSTSKVYECAHASNGRNTRHN